MRRLLQKHRVNYLDPSGQQGVFDPDSFRFTLRRERERADRFARQFSLIVLRLPGDRSNNSDHRTLNAVADKIRIVDSIGWFDASSLGILLPDASADEAVRFLDEIAPIISDADSVAGIEVHTYPDPARPGQPAGEIVAGGRSAIFVRESSDSSSLFFSNIFSATPGMLWSWLEQAVAGIVLALLSPLFLLIVLAIKISSPGPALFHQERVGYKGVPFDCYKFRSMHPHSETHNHEEYFSYLITNDVPMQKLDRRGDSRIFPVGRLLRASSLDELPQLVNMLKGEMRFVGPRPSTPYEFAQFLPWQRHRVDAMPGVSGLWQVSGKNNTTFAEMIRLDLRYIRERSLFFDLWIIFKTVPVVIGLFLEEHYGRKTARDLAASRAVGGAGQPRKVHQTE